MGNHAYKKEQARIHNENRAYELAEKEKIRIDMINNPEKYRGTRRSRARAREILAIYSSATVNVGTVGRID